MPKLKQKTESKPQPLPIELKKNKFLYTQIRVDRDAGLAMYEQYDPEHEKVVGYEIFFIKIQKPTTVNFGGTDVELEHKEMFPSNNDFGKTAWSTTPVLSVATRKFNQKREEQKNA